MIRAVFAFAAAVALLSSGAAHADCPAANRYSFAYGNQAAATLAYGSTYTYSATTSGGASQTFTVNIAQNGLSSTTAGGSQMPQIGTLITAPSGANDLVLGGTFSSRTADISTGTRAVTVTVTFSTPIRDFSVTVHDIDFTTNQYRDWLFVSGVGKGVTYTPSLVTPWGNSNATGGARTNGSSSVTLGPSSTPITLTAFQGVGTGASANNSDTGTVTASFAQPVTVVTIRYGNAPLTTGETATGQQAMGIQGFSYCPMPQLALTKTSAPVSGALGAFNLPGSDVLYTFSVVNSGGSPVDAATIALADQLPANIVFKNATLDTPSGLPFSISAGSSGVTLNSGSASYSNNGGSTFAYSPAVGYDPAVNAVRVTPSGMMAANSSFTISFVGRIK